MQLSWFIHMNSKNFSPPAGRISWYFRNIPLLYILFAVTVSLWGSICVACLSYMTNLRWTWDDSANLGCQKNIWKKVRGLGNFWLKRGGLENSMGPGKFFLKGGAKPKRRGLSKKGGLDITPELRTWLMRTLGYWHLRHLGLLASGIKNLSSRLLCLSC